MHFNRIFAIAAAVAAPASALATLYENLGSSSRIVPGKFIVKLKDTVSESTANEVESLMDDVDYVYKVDSFKAFAGSLNDDALESVRAHPGVDYIERNVIVPAASYVTQHEAPWGLGRISHKGPENFTDGTTYVYDDSAGEGVCVYVLDSGIRVDHEEFEGRAEYLANYTPGPDTDTFEHGTHVAGTVGGATYGVAKKVSLYSVKISGWGESVEAESENVMMGMAFVANDSQTRQCPNGTVANISYGFPHSHGINDLALALLNVGVFVVVAAGNEATDGCNASDFSPSSEPGLCTVGATDKNNRMAYFSNPGSVVDILAPGVDVLSASPISTTASELMDGTSMATPHIAGLAACLLASKHIDPKSLCDYMVETANPLITNVRNDTVNLVAFNGAPVFKMAT